MEEPAHQGSARVAVDLVDVEIGEAVVISFTNIPVNGPLEISGQPPKPSCETCRFYVESYREDAASWGHCHRRSPVPLMNSTGWPSVSYETWCGEYEKSLTPPPHPVA